MLHSHHSSRPYFRFIIFQLLIVGFFFLVVINVTIFTVLNTRIFTFSQESVQLIAENVASNIPATLHDSLVTPAQQESDEYTVLKNYFQIAMDANPRIDDIYTLRPTGDPDVMTFVVAGKDNEDVDGDVLFDENELKPQIGEPYDVSELPDLKKGFVEPTADQQITYDKWGSWISGYAPLRDGSGKPVAVVGVDLSASVVTDQRSNIIKIILLLDLFAIPFLFGTSYLVSRRLTRSFYILAEGMDQLSHGNIDYQLPLKYKQDGGVFRILFNDMVAMFKNLKSEAEEKAESQKKK